MKLVWFIFLLHVNPIANITSGPTQVEINMTGQWGLKSDGFATKAECQSYIDNWKITNKHIVERDKLFCKELSSN